MDCNYSDKRVSEFFYIDLDGFKSVNDSGGHILGDWVLKEVAHILHSCLRDEDTIARIGGDEFSILIRNPLNKEDSYRLAQKIIDLVSAIHIPDYNHLILGASIGILHLPNPTVQTIEDLIGLADNLMYQAKREGKNRFVSS